MELLAPKGVQPLKFPDSNPELVRILYACISPVNRSAINVAQPATTFARKTFFEITILTTLKVVPCFIARLWILFVQAKCCLRNSDRRNRPLFRWLVSNSEHSETEQRYPS